ncbi:MAG TPA: aminomethyl-transferring glycine dehydrogenase subunit GcvPB [Candidatus Limnocylindria bacterium]|nr:aminomethyl-transferring glycine dehydrogenase subunit GcvPB [Candidatus Limnocylindria bacterium]
MTAVGPAARNAADPARAASGEPGQDVAGGPGEKAPLGRSVAVGPALQPTLAELSRPGRGGGKVPHPPADALDGVPPELRRRQPLALPELSEPEVIRHFVNLSQLNYAVDTGFYPLGSCTMKYNPKINEWAARLAGFAALHPLAPDELAQGTLALLWELEQWLAEISGMAAVSLQPAAGAQGELTGILMIRAHHRARGDEGRREVIVPDSSHGTNPATASMAGFRAVTVRSNDRGEVDLDALRAALGAQTAAVMLTNPSTLGLFETRIDELLAAVHEAGALAYMDGANMNAVLGRFKPGRAGFDVMHFNTHKTFSTPHGGGGPGAGPVAVNETLLPYLPGPRVLRGDDGSFRLERQDERTTSIGRVRSYAGSVGVLVRAYAYLLAHGGPGLRQVSEDAVLAANYLKSRVAQAYELPYPQACKHEFVASARRLRSETGVRMLDVAKRLIDYGFHPPTIYFPLTVEESMLVEPTETESVETLDRFADALLAIAEEARSDPQALHDAPRAAPVRRLDEATAARQPDLRWRPMTGAEPVCPS